jgi:hypothetical protein
MIAWRQSDFDVVESVGCQARLESIEIINACVAHLSTHITTRQQRQKTKKQNKPLASVNVVATIDPSLASFNVTSVLAMTGSPLTKPTLS